MPCPADATATCTSRAMPPTDPSGKVAVAVSMTTVDDPGEPLPEAEDEP